MNKPLRNLFLILLSTIVLISGSGIFVMIHTCFSSHKTEVTFSSEHKCCKTERFSPYNTAVSKKCCSVVYYYHKLKIDTILNEHENSVEPHLITCSDFANCPIHLAKFSLFINQKYLDVGCDRVIAFKQLLI